MFVNLFTNNTNNKLNFNTKNSSTNTEHQNNFDLNNTFKDYSRDLNKSATNHCNVNYYNKIIDQNTINNLNSLIFRDKYKVNNIVNYNNNVAKNHNILRLSKIESLHSKKKTINENKNKSITPVKLEVTSNRCLDKINELNIKLKNKKSNLNNEFLSRLNSKKLKEVSLYNLITNNKESFFNTNNLKIVDKSNNFIIDKKNNDNNINKLNKNSKINMPCLNFNHIKNRLDSYRTNYNFISNSKDTNVFYLNSTMYNSKTMYASFDRLIFWQDKITNLLNSYPDEYFLPSYIDNIKIYLIYDNNENLYKDFVLKGLFLEIYKYSTISINDLINCINNIFDNKVKYTNIFSIQGSIITSISNFYNNGNSNMFYLSCNNNISLCENNYFVKIKDYLLNTMIIPDIIDINTNKNKIYNNFLNEKNNLSKLDKTKFLLSKIILKFPSKALYLTLNKDELEVKKLIVDLDKLNKEILNRNKIFINKLNNMNNNYYNCYINYNNSPFTSNINIQEFIYKLILSFNSNCINNSERSSSSILIENICKNNNKSKVSNNNILNNNKKKYLIKSNKLSKLNENNLNVFQALNKIDKDSVINNLNKFPNISRYVFFELLTKYNILKKLSFQYKLSSSSLKTNKNKLIKTPASGITFETFYQGIPQMSIEEKNLARKIFNSLKEQKYIINSSNSNIDNKFKEENKSNEIDFNKKCKLTIKDYDIENYSDDVLKMEDFITGLSIVMKPDFKEKIGFFFNIIDEDGNGNLSFDEVKSISKISLQRNIAGSSEDKIKSSELVEDLANHFSKYIFHICGIDINEEISLDILIKNIGNKENGRALEMFCGADNFIL